MRALSGQSGRGNALWAGGYTCPEDTWNQDDLAQGSPMAATQGEWEETGGVG